ncbi:glycine zipper 2TM domain-containing protein [Propionivibrio sp.]|uniref:glycine zipper 2TM domain-containing protein n=1 Tax=Propionivibrio sp. TaxID=2212460 RepID=UPI0026079F69|nr:glycine zipper 2TM domain-containing protein [Propionivibrio sp.]
MDKSMVKGVVIGGIAALAVAASGVTGYKALTKPRFAEVLAVKDVTETVKTPREECHDVQVRHQAPVKDENRIAGKVAGGVIGGALGSMVGSGRGSTVAMVAGAAGGAYAGNQVQKNMQEKDTVTTTEARCKTVYDSSEKHIGYDVSYRLEGKQDVVRLAYNPGSQIPVKDGKLVLEPPQK